MVPTQARAVVIGGGIMGCSVAYHLARLGWRDTVLLERERLTSGTTFHAAGMVGQSRTSANVTRLLKDSVALYRRLATMARGFGLEMHILGPGEAPDLWPPMDISDVLGAALLPTDGQADPSGITQALARGARTAGATVVEDCPVRGISLSQGRVAGVVTGQGTIACEAVINCAGRWAAAAGRGVRRKDGMGAAQLVPPAGDGPGRPLFLRPSQLVRGRRRRAPGGAGAGGPFRAKLLRQVFVHRTGRRPGPGLALRQPCDRAAGPPDLYPDA